jgi:hypothetical protein
MTSVIDKIKMRVLRNNKNEALLKGVEIGFKQGQLSLKKEIAKKCEREGHVDDNSGILREIKEQIQGGKTE